MISYGGCASSGPLNEGLQIYRLDVLTDNGLLRADIKQFQSSAQPLATITGWLKSCPLGQCQFDASVPMILRWQRPRRGVCCAAKASRWRGGTACTDRASRLRRSCTRAVLNDDFAGFHHWGKWRALPGGVRFGREHLIVARNQCWALVKNMQAEDRLEVDEHYQPKLRTASNTARVRTGAAS